MEKERVYCIKCGYPISIDDDYCEHCGAVQKVFSNITIYKAQPQTHSISQKSKKFPIILLGICAIVLLIIVIFLYLYIKKNASDLYDTNQSPSIYDMGNTASSFLENSVGHWADKDHMSDSFEDMTGIHLFINSVTEDMVNFDLYKMSESGRLCCVESQYGDIVNNQITFNFRDSFNNYGNGSIEILEDSLYIKTDITSYAEGANYNLALDCQLFKVSDKVLFDCTDENLGNTSGDFDIYNFEVINQYLIEEDGVIIDGQMINTPYYSFYVPESWNEQVIIEYEPGYHFIFYSKPSFENNFQGHLCSINAYTSEDEYMNNPSYVYLDESDGLQFVAILPTDVQYDMDNEFESVTYQTLYEEINNLLVSFQINY